MRSRALACAPVACPAPKRRSHRLLAPAGQSANAAKGGAPSARGAPSAEHHWAAPGQASHRLAAASSRLAPRETRKHKPLHDDRDVRPAHLDMPTKCFRACSLAAATQIAAPFQPVLGAGGLARAPCLKPSENTSGLLRANPRGDQKTRPDETRTTERRLPLAMH